MAKGKKAKSISYEELRAELGDKLTINTGSPWKKARKLNNPMVAQDECEKITYDSGSTGMYYVASDGGKIPVRGNREADQFEWFEVVADRDATPGFGTYKKGAQSVALFAAE